jgi:hypothetical protein
MTDLQPSQFPRLKEHFRECLALYLVLILGLTVLFFLIVDPNKSPPEVFRWLREISPLADTIVMYIIALGLSGLCLLGIVRNLRRALSARKAPSSVPSIPLSDLKGDASADRPNRNA